MKKLQVTRASVSAVKSRLHRARQAMARHLVALQAVAPNLESALRGRADTPAAPHVSMVI